MLRQVLSVVALSALVAVPARADDMVNASLQLCEKVKACAVERMNQEEMTPEVRQMMQPALDNMCVKLQQGMGAAPSGHPAYAPAVTCMRSMMSLSCEQLMAGDSKTAECAAYEKVARETYEPPQAQAQEAE